MIDPPASHQAAGQPADDHVASTTAADLAAELVRVRERLAFYESFDSLIRDNVARSGELLREVAAEREHNNQKLLEMRAEVDRSLAEQRSALEEIAAGLAGLQANLGSLSERVANSLNALPGAGSAALPIATAHDTTATGRALTQSSDQPGETAQMSTSAFPASAASSPAPERVPGVPELRTEPAPVPAIAAPAGAPSAVARPGATEAEGSGSELAGAAVTEASVPDVAGPARRKIDLIVHGVPRAATALSLQRHLQELSGVEGVEVREYVSGVLRFQVVAAALGPDDLRGWQNGDALEVVTVRDNVLELKLPSAEGF